MTKFLKFFFSYNIKSWTRNKLQILFSICGIAMGIAIVLAIQILSTYNSLNLEEKSRSVNGGDISINTYRIKVTDKQIEELRAIKGVDYTFSFWNAATVKVGEKSSNIILRFVDNNAYPLYEMEREKVNYKENLQIDKTIILSENLASRLDVKENDEINLFNNLIGENEIFTVTKIVKSDGETGQDMNIFGYGILSESRYSIIHDNNLISKIYVKVNNKEQINEIKDKLQDIFQNSEITTAKDVFEKSKKEIESTKNSLYIIGIFTFIISGIGVANTILLSVLKRQKEICMLKAMGMKNIEIVLCMEGEACIISILSSFIGIPLGILFSTLVNHNIYGEWIESSKLSFVVYPAINVIVISILISLVFAFIPALISSKMKPIYILREQYISSKKKTQMIEPILGIALLLGGIFSVLLKSFKGFIYCFEIFIIGSILYLLLYIILKAISKLGLFIHGKTILSLRNISRNSNKLVLVLLTLVIGIISIGVTMNISNSIIPSLKKTIENQNGYNMILTTSIKNKDKLEKRLADENDVDSFTQSLRFKTIFKGMNGQNKEIEFQEKLAKFNKKEVLDDLVIEGALLKTSNIMFDMKEGRFLNKSDKGTNNTVINSELADCMGIKVDDEIEMEIENKAVNLKVIGIKKKTILNTSQITADFDMLNTNSLSNSAVYYINAKEKKIDSLAKDLNKEIKDAFVLNFNDLLPALNETINNQIKLLTFISIFCILASLFLMSNIILITFLDRKKEILMLKVAGAKNIEIYKIILFESICMGTIAGIIAAIINEILTNLFFTKMLKVEYAISYAISMKIIGVSILVVCIPALLVIRSMKIKKIYILLRSE